MAAKTAILKAKIEGVIYELMTKTDAANVYVDESTTLASKLSSIIADIATKASTKDLTDGLALKAEKSHKHEQGDINGLSDLLTTLATTNSVNTAIENLRQEMLGDTPVDAYNTFTELAAYISEHQEVSDALSAAIGQKADKATTLAGYGITDAYTITQVNEKIAEQITAATGGVKASEVQTALDNYKSATDGRLETLEGAKHTHANKTVLDGITDAKVQAWDGKSDSNIYYSATQPAGLTEKDLWVQIVS